MLKKKFLFLICVIFFSNLQAQDFIEDITGFFEHEIGKQKDTSHYHTKYVLAPILSYEPSTSLGLGIGSKLLFKFPKSFEETRTSNIPFAARYTLRNQFIFNTDFTIFSNQEKWMFKGEVAYLKYPFFYYGIGNRTTEGEKVEIDFKQFLFEPLILKRVAKYFFIGGGLRVNSVFDVYEVAHVNGRESEISREDSLSVRASGIELAASYDSRDNILNASSGYFVEYTLGTYHDQIGSTHSFNLSKLNARTYLKVWENRLDVVAFEFYSRFSWGDVPLLEFSPLGGQELLRGVPEGRYRDRHSIYLQSEYRWQTWERFGFVFYTGVGDVFHNAQGLNIQELKYNVGTGIRLKIVKSENLNIRMDYGFVFGHQFDHNFYLNIAEAF